MPRRIRSFVLICAFLAMLGVSTASASPAHFHAESAANGCDVCFLAHTVAFETPALQPVYRPEMRGEAMLLPAASGYRARVARPSFSRGPPSLCL